MGVYEILEDLEDLVTNGKHVPFTNNVIIDEADLVRLIDDLRNQLPGELSKAEQVMQDRTAIIAAARDEASGIVEQAKEYANKLVDNEEIVVQAREKAQNIVDQAMQQEKDISEKTMQNCRQRTQEVDQYANQVFDHMITNVSSALNILKQAQSDLNRSHETDFGE